MFKPKNIYIKENQLELLLDTINLVAAYPVKKTTTTVIMPSENTKIIQYTLENSNKSGEKIIYSLTEEIPPFIKKKIINSFY